MSLRDNEYKRRMGEIYIQDAVYDASLEEKIS